MVERRIRAARFPAVKSLDTFDFTAIPEPQQDAGAGTGPLRVSSCAGRTSSRSAIAAPARPMSPWRLAWPPARRASRVAFTTAAALVNQLMEARDERRLLKLQRDLQAVKLLIVDELGYVPLSPTGAELLFEIFSQRYERGSTIVTSNLPFEDWTSVLGSERLTGALLDRLTHHVSILTMNGDSYRLKQSAGRRRDAAIDGAEQNQATTETVDPEPARSPHPDPETTAATQKRAPIGALFCRSQRHRHGLLLLRPAGLELLRR